MGCFKRGTELPADGFPAVPEAATGSASCDSAEHLRGYGNPEI